MFTVNHLALRKYCIMFLITAFLRRAFYVINFLLFNKEVCIEKPYVFTSCHFSASRNCSYIKLHYGARPSIRHYFRVDSFP